MTTITIKELNERIDELIEEYEEEARENPFEAAKNNWKIQGLQELKIQLNDPEPATDLTENVQQSLNVIAADKLINPPKGDQNTR